MVGEKVFEGQVMVGHVEGLGESSMLIPREEGVEVLGCSVNEGVLVRSTTSLDSDMSGMEEREVVLGSLNSNLDQLEVGGAGLESGLVPFPWNPFVDPEESLGLDLGDNRVDFVPILDGVDARDQEGGFLKETSQLSGGGAQVVFSDVSSPPSQDVSNVKLVNNLQKIPVHLSLWLVLHCQER
jgi:hypothetical protein